MVVPGGYVASEESALVNFLNGGPAVPLYVPPRPFERGLGGQATLVNNVETLAHIALIARYGPDWFGAVGTRGGPRIRAGDGRRGGGAARRLRDRPGPARRPADRAGRRPVRAAAGPAGRRLLRRLAAPARGCRGAGQRARAPLGRRLARRRRRDRAARGLLRAGRDRPGAALPGRARAPGSAGPCTFGLPAIADALAHIAWQGRDERAAEWLRSLLPLVDKRGACHLPDGAAALVASALRVFAADLEQHVSRGPCPAARRPPVLPVPRAPGGRP